MGFFDIFRRRKAIGDLPALATFVDRQSAFLAQKGVYEYSRARAGRFAAQMFQEPAFIEAVEKSRWRAFPLALIMVGEALEGFLRPLAADRAPAMRRGLIRLVLSTFDRYPVPGPIGADGWREMREEVERALSGVSLHPPKPVIDIPEPYAQRYFALMPIHERMRGEDLPTTRVYLKVTLVNIHEQFRRRMDAPVLVSQLIASGEETA
jgi:hypothetical protein